MSLILREFEWKFALNLIETQNIWPAPSFTYIYKCLYTSCLLLPECYLLVFRIENTVDGWDISYSKMPSLSMLAGLSRHEAKFPGNIFLLIKKMKMFLNCWNWKIQIDVCSANYQFEEIWNIVLRQKLQKLKTLLKVILLSFRLIISPTTFIFWVRLPKWKCLSWRKKLSQDRFISNSVSVGVSSESWVVSSG